MRLFGHVQCKQTMALARKSFFVKADGPSRKRGRPQTTLMEIGRIDMKNCNLATYLRIRYLDRFDW